MINFHKLKGDHRKSVSNQSWQHEQECGDLYVTLRKYGLISDWIHTSDQKDGLRFDRAAVIHGKQFYFEIERGTQTVADIRQKVEQYLKLPGRFHVVFTVQDYRPNPFEKVVKTAKDFGGEILAMLASYHRNNQFVVAPHLKLVADPNQPCLVSPAGQVYSFESIR